MSKMAKAIELLTKIVIERSSLSGPKLGFRICQSTAPFQVNKFLLNFGRSTHEL
jgi:hypothetical protein